jgi:outer membrane protein assembly factor BamB
MGMAAFRRALMLALILLLGPVCVSAQDGWEWRFVAGGATVGSGAFSENGYYYFVAEDRFLYALDANGIMVWRTDLGRRPAGAVVVGPDGSIYVTLETGALLALNQDGRLIWRVNPFDSMLYAPVVSDTGMLIVAEEDGGIAAYSHRGMELWRVRLEVPIASAPIIGFSGTLLVPTVDAFVIELTLAGEVERRQFVNEEASILISGSDRYYLGSTSGRVLSLSSDLLPEWRADVGSAVRELLLSSDGDIYVTADDQTLSRITGPGAVAWRADFSPAIPGSPVATDGVLVPVSSGLLSRLDRSANMTMQLRLPGRPVSLVVSPAGIAILTTDRWVTYAYRVDSVPAGSWAQARGSFRRAGVPAGVRTGRYSEGAYTATASYLMLRSQLLGRDESAQRVALARIRADIDSDDGVAERYFVYLDLLERVAGSPYFGPLSQFGPQSASRRAREEAIALLGRIGDLESARFLSRLLSYEPDASLQSAIMVAIGAVGSELDEQMVAYLAEVIRKDQARGAQDRVASSVITLVRGLDSYQGRYIDPGIAEVLISIATSNYSSEIRQQALATLRSLAGASEL